MKTVYLHIGIGKTGTTSIQNYFLTHSEALFRNNIFLPEAGRDDSGAYHRLATHSSMEMNSDTHKLYKNLTDEISQSEPDRVFISSEQFCFLKPHFIASMRQYLSPFRVIVIFYVRNQIPLIESAFLEVRKWPRNYRPEYYDQAEGDIGKYFRIIKKAFDYQVRIEPWVNNFGQDNIVARLYDSRVMGDDVCLDVLKLLDLAHIYQSGNSKKNTSLLPEFCELVELLDREEIPESSRHAMLNEVIRLSEHFRGVSRQPMMSEALREEVAEYYKNSNVEFGRRFFDTESAALLCEPVG